GKVHKALTRGNVVVVDLGSGTTIIDNYKNIKRVGGEVMNSGMNQFLSNIAKKMSNQTGVSFTPEQINQGLRNQTYKAEDAQASYPFDRLFHEETAETIDNIIGKYMEVVEQENMINTFILTGGGAHVVGDAFVHEQDNFYKVKNPQIATVNGYYKLACSIDMKNNQ